MRGLDLRQGETRTVTTVGDVSDPTLSPDGRSIAYCGDGTTIRLSAVP